MMKRSKLMAAICGAALVAATGCASGGGTTTVRPTTVGQFNGADSCLERLFTYERADRAHWEEVERVCESAANNPALDSISKKSFGLFNVGRAKIELAGMTTDFGSAQEYYRAADSIYEDLTQDNPGFNEAKLEYAKAQAGLSNFDRAVVILSPLESLGAFDRTNADYILNLRAKLTKAQVLKAKAEQYGEPNDSDMLVAIAAYNTAWSDSAPMPAEISDPNSAIRASIRSSARAGLISAASDVADRGMARAPYEQEAVTRARRALDAATAVVKADISANPSVAARSVELARLSNQLGQSELLLAGFEGPGRDADFRCASGQGLGSRLQAALAAYETANANSENLTREKADAQGGIGCATQALAPTDSQSRNIRLSQLGDAREAFVAARDNDPRSESNKPERHLQLGRLLKDLALLQRDIVISRPGAEDRLPANAVSTLNEAIASYSKAIISADTGADAARREYVARTNARTNLDIAEAYTELRQPEQAHAYLLQATAAGTDIAFAKLQHGLYHYRLRQQGAITIDSGDGEVGAEHIAVAYREFASARDIAANPGKPDPQTQARALLYLSKVNTEYPNRGGSQTALLNDAVAFAKQALALTDSDEIREQECLARIRRGDGGAERYLTGDNQEAIDAEARCTNALQSPRSFLLKGMYRFRLHHYQRTTQQLRNLQLAIIAFEDGAKLHDTNVLPKTKEENDVRARLELGLGTAQVCAAQDIIGQRRIDAMNVSDAEAAGRYLATYDVARCARSR